MLSDYSLFPLSYHRYPAAHLRVEIVLLTIDEGRLKVLMRHWQDDPFAGQMILPGGFVRDRVSLDACASAILYELCELHEVRLEQFHVFSNPHRDPRGWVVSVGLLGFVPSDLMVETVAAKQRLQLIEAHYNESVDLSTLLVRDFRIHPGFDHEDIIVAAIRHARAHLQISSQCLDLLESEFTLLELQAMHEAILNEKLSPVTFRKRMLGRTFADGSHLAYAGCQISTGGRPAQLYRLAAREL